MFTVYQTRFIFSNVIQNICAPSCLEHTIQCLIQMNTIYTDSSEIYWSLIFQTYKTIYEPFKNLLFLTRNKKLTLKPRNITKRSAATLHTLSACICLTQALLFLRICLRTYCRWACVVVANNR